MKFLLDSQIPERIAHFLEEEDFSVERVPVSLNDGQYKDKNIREWADSDNRVLVSYDSDFWLDHLILGSPMSLLLIRRESFSSSLLLELFQEHLDDLVNCFMQHRVAELGRDSLVILR